MRRSMGSFPGTLIAQTGWPGTQQKQSNCNGIGHSPVAAIRVEEARAADDRHACTRRVIPAPGPQRQRYGYP